ncbi:SpvB/TcaC N-terminal domain-containing protein [Burkholderia stabilis]|nr:SpvB/TcaC N-terminal domain-containing protein [Burkholderia stabilis]
MGESLGETGITGQAGLSVPLPVSAGRGYAPSLSLEYSSDHGNGAFGLGWQVPLLAISRDTRHGVPRYDEQDVFLAPNGEVLVPERDDQNRLVSRSVSAYGGVTLDKTYIVTRYLPSVLQAFERIERWQEQASGDFFWLIHTVDGQLHCLGKHAAARITDPGAPNARIGRWLLEESVSPTGEHVCYQYEAEDVTNVDVDGPEADRLHTANRYLSEVRYGNLLGYAPLYAWDAPGARPPEWLFSLVFDYGRRTLEALTVPGRDPSVPWPCRPDSFSDYSLGFEIRTHRLCHQVLMFHHFPDELTEPSTLVQRLLFTYDQTPYVSQLIVAQTLAYERDGTMLSMPPLELAYTSFAPALSVDDYQLLPAFAGWNDGRPYQLVDLYGEGLPGILYRDGSDWRYQAPERDPDALPNGITYGAWDALPSVPALQPEARGLLMDLTGDGQLDWLIVQPALNGYFTLGPDRQWSHFVPGLALPTEFFHPAAQFVDAQGSGLMDLALISSNSVRVYPNMRAAGFGTSFTVAQSASTPLPVSLDPATLVAFSDVLGSGQQHLVRIQHNCLECWPNLGGGHFGTALRLASLPFDAGTFNSDRVFLADLDGSGAADLIYVESNRILIFLNRCGNGFDTTPRVLPLPAGVNFDSLCQISFADLDGTGTSDLVLSVVRPEPRHWRFAFTAGKPYLLRTICNNLGASTTLTFRSSAQEWLDQKSEEPASECGLPFPLPVLSRTDIKDEITGNTLTDLYRYRNGVYAGREREFRGFGLIEHIDAASAIDATSDGLIYATPTLTRQWYHTGQEHFAIEGIPAPYQDGALFTLGPTRFTALDPKTDQDEPLSGEVRDTAQAQLWRALKGCPLRTETYNALDQPEFAIPFAVQAWRYQVRLVQPAATAGTDCVGLPMPLEQLSVNYERIAHDPTVQQSISVQVDSYGVPLRSVTVHYPRRPKPASNPYAPDLPDTWWQASHDETQHALRLNEERQRVHHLDDPQVWRLGLPFEQRQNVITDPSGRDYYYPASTTGLSHEALREPNGVLGATQTRVLAGQSVTYYFDNDGAEAQPVDTPPPPLALVHHVEVAELDETALAVIEALPNLEAELDQAGYRRSPTILVEPGVSEPPVWVAPRGYATYVDQAGLWLPFYRPRSTQSSRIVGSQQFTYDPHTCVVISVTNAFGNRVTARYDYRFLEPLQVTDPNANVEEVRFDALGRVLASSFHGSELDEQGVPHAVGFASLNTFDPNVAALGSIEAALADPTGALQDAASACLYDLYCWTGHLTSAQLAPHVSAEQIPALWQALQQAHLITASGHILTRGHVWARNGLPLPGLPPALQTRLRQIPQSPVQAAVLSADRYPGSPAKQIPITLSLSDGFGRALQTKQKAEPGPAYVVDDQGRFVLDANGQPRIADTGADPRWAVSGRVIYNEKAEPIRVYQPYFLDQPRYVNDLDMVNWGYADTYMYDSLGRWRERLTPLRFRHRIRYYPWFTVEEDENDTLNEVLDTGPHPSHAGQDN